MNELDLFAAAIAIADPAERAALLDRECAGRSGLRQRLDLLLAAHAQPQPLIDAGCPDGTGAYAPTPSLVGTVIAGRYKLLEAIGEGGMGAVWMAEQREPVKRLVALKLIKPGMDSRAVLARFEAERQALALMDHPNIAKVLDGGTTAEGRPYFVMEMVKGLPLTEYCDARQLTVRDRLELFGQVCSAVQHAHQKGVIHRDLKPTNVLVTEHDGKPVPKVIDFGLAKALSAANNLTDKTLHTAFGSVVGTPLYMAPEQVGINALDVDTRTDIYALGVILYELLTGTTPLEKKQLREAAWDEMRRLIREEEPPRPSMRLSTSDALPSLAAGRQIEPARLTKLVRGELDWIVMKALEKDRNRRYETANGLAKDVERHLAGEPVLAVPPSAGYRLRKFARKNRGALTTVAAILILLVAGAALSTWQAMRATRAETVARLAEQDALAAQRAEAERAEGERRAKLDAEARRADAERQKTRAEAGEKLAGERLVQVDAEKQKAEAEKQIAQAVLGFLQNKLLRQADTGAQADTLLRAGGLAAVKEAKANPTILELLDRAAQELTPDKIDANLPKQVQPAILFTVGNTYLGVGEYERAIGFLDRAAALYQKRFGPDHDTTLSGRARLGLAYRDAGKPDQALPICREVFEHAKAKYGPDHPKTIVYLHNLADAYRASGQLDQALPLFQETSKYAEAKFGRDDRFSLLTRSELAGAYYAARKVDRAVPLLEETVELTKAKFGPHHPETLGRMHNLAVVYASARKLDQALPLYEETLRLKKAHIGPDHPSTLVTMENLALAYQAAKLPDLAAALQEEVLERRKAKLGADDPKTLASINRLAAAYLAARKFNQALPLYEEALKLVEGKQGHEHPDTLVAMNNLAGAYRAAGKLDLAISRYVELVKHRKETLGSDHPDTLASMWALATVYGGCSPNGGGVSFDRAIPLYEEVWKIRQKNLPEGDRTRINSQAQLGFTLVLAGRFAEAEPHLLASFRDGSSAKDFPHEWLEAYALRLACLYAEWAKRAEVEKWQLELNNLGGPTERRLATTSVQMLEAARFRAAELLLQVRKAKLGPEHPNTLGMMWALVGGYRDALRFDRAIPLAEELWSIRRQILPEGDRTRIDTQNQLGLLLYFAGRFAEAEPHLLGSYKDSTSAKDLPKHVLPNYARRLMCLYAEWDKPAEQAQWQAELNRVGGTSESQLASSGLGCLKGARFRAAEVLLRECLAIREKERPDHWVTFNVKSMLGGALLGQKKYTDAEPLLVAGYEGMKQREQQMSGKAILSAGLERLIEFYTATDKPDEVRKWRAERAKYPPPEKK